MKDARKERMAAKGSQKTKVRAKESRKGNRKASLTKEKKREKAVLVIDPRARASQTSGATHAASMGILLESAGRINRSVQ